MANTTADKLALLEATKADLKAALAEKGQTVGDVFSTYPAAVRAIETGGVDTVSIQIYGSGNFNAFVSTFENGQISSSVLRNPYGTTENVVKNSYITFTTSPLNTSGSVVYLGGSSYVVSGSDAAFTFGGVTPP